MARATSRGFWVTLLALPLVILAIHIGVGLASSAEPKSPPTPSTIQAACEFPGAEHKRLIVAIVDSLRDETATDPRLMPWLSGERRSALWGRMTPCSSQLSLLCLRTMFEGFEPLLVTGLHNFTGMGVAESSLIHRLARGGVRVAAVADAPFIRLYQSSLFMHAAFEERPKSKSRDEFARLKTFEWLADPRVDVLISHTIDTDAVAHRFGIGHPEYAAKFRETDAFLAELAAGLRPTDSLLVLGDHGHDARGYHSTGIPALTTYFAWGASFPRGKQRDLEMADAHSLMGGVTCQQMPSVAGGRASIARSEVLPHDIAALFLLFLVLVTATSALTSLPWVKRTLALGAALVVVLGLVAPWLLVTLQNHVNAAWTIGFWVVVSSASLALAAPIARWLGAPYRLAAGLSAWGLIFFGLFLGPYYYGSGRNLFFGVSWLLLASALPFARERRVQSSVLLGILPLIPLFFVALKEWEVRYPLLEFANGLGAPRVAVVIAALVGLAVLISPERQSWLRPSLALAGFVLLGVWMQFAGATLLGASLLVVSYVATCQCVRELRALDGRSKATSLLQPITQVSYAFMLYFVLLGSLRFANVDFRFALAWTPIEQGEAVAALTAIPLVSIKYLVPIGLLLALGPRLDPRALVLLLGKALAMGFFWLGMELGGGRGLYLFQELQIQELVLCALLYMTLLLAFVLRIGRSGRPDLVEVLA